MACADTTCIQRLLRGLEPIKTTQTIAARIGHSEKSVEGWLSGRAFPNGRAIIALVAAYGPMVLSAFLPQRPAWLDAASREAERAKLADDMAQLAVKLKALQP